MNFAIQNIILYASFTNISFDTGYLMIVKNLFWHIVFVANQMHLSAIYCSLYVKLHVPLHYYVLENVY